MTHASFLSRLSWMFTRINSAVDRRRRWHCRFVRVSSRTAGRKWWIWCSCCRHPVASAPAAGRTWSNSSQRSSMHSTLTTDWLASDCSGLYVYQPRTPIHAPQMVVSVADLEGVEPAPPPSPLGRRTDAVTVLLLISDNCKHALQNTQNYCHQWLSRSFRVHQIRTTLG